MTQYYHTPAGYIVNHQSQNQYTPITNELHQLIIHEIYENQTTPHITLHYDKNQTLVLILTNPTRLIHFTNQHITITRYQHEGVYRTIQYHDYTTIQNLINTIKS